MSGVCPAITLIGDTSVSGSLHAMDCKIEQAVETGYDRLFGAGGAFADTLTVALTIYVALLAYGFLTGRTRLTMAMLSPRLMTMVLVLTFVTVWPAYHTIFFGLFMGGPDYVASALLGQRGSAVMIFAQNLDTLFVRFADITRHFEPSPGTVASAFSSTSSATSLFWLSGMILLLSTLGALILSRLVLYLLLILGPIFIVLALFGQTRGLFNGWLRTSFVFALAPLLIVLGGTGALKIFVPLIDYIGNDPQRAAHDVQPMIVLFMGALVYAAFLLTLMWVASSLAKDWQAALRDKSSGDLPSLGNSRLPVATVAQWSAANISARTGEPDSRTQALTQAVGNMPSSITVQVAATANAAGRGAGDNGYSRVQGLGQRFRTPKQVTHLSDSTKPQS